MDWAARPRMLVITGHYGSGKTELALNVTAEFRRRGLSAALVDLDIVNPFFRSAERGERLRAMGAEVLAPDFALSAVDVPSLPARIQSVFERGGDARVVIDVGGDDAGARALGRYREGFSRGACDFLYVVNAFRPRSGTADEVLAMMERVAAASRLTPTGLVNNANLGGETTCRELEAGMALLREVSARSGLPVVCSCAAERALEGFSGEGAPVFAMERWLKPDWMDV